MSMRVRNAVGLAGAMLSASGLLSLLCLASAFGQDQRTAQSDCNAPPGEPIAYLVLPGHPFGTVSTQDGCWLFTSLTSSNPKSGNGIGLIERSGGRLTFSKFFLVETGPAGMVMTHDEELLIVADGDYVVFMDVSRMISGKGDPILGYMSDGDSAGSVYVNVTDDDKLLFVSDEWSEAISVINLQKARAEGFKESAIIGKIPVGRTPIALTFSPDQRWLYTTSQIAPESYKWPKECRPEGAPETAPLRNPKGAVIVVDVGRARTDPASSIVGKVPAGCNPVRLAISPSGDQAYVTARNSNSLLAFDTARLRTGAADALIGAVPTGSAPVGVIVVNDGKQILVTNSNRFSTDTNARQMVTVIDASKVGAGSGAVMGTIPAGAFPREFALSPDKRTVFLTNFNSSELQVIDLSRMEIEPTRASPRRH